MEGNLRNRKILYKALRALMIDADNLRIKMDADPVRSAAFDRTSLVIGGFVAALPLLLEAAAEEISRDENEARMHKELMLLLEQERDKFKRLPTEPPPPEAP